MASFDMKKLSSTDKGVAGAGVLALIALFLPWESISFGGISDSASGFSTGYGWIGAILIIASAVYLVMLRSGSEMPKTSTGPGVIVLGGSVIGVVLVLLRWLTLPKGGSGFDGASWGPGIGIYLTIIAGVVSAVCAWRLFKSSGESLPWENKTTSGGAS